MKTPCTMHCKYCIFSTLTTKSLESLDLSYNEHLTSISLRRLQHYSSIKSVDLYGCENILRYFECADEKTWSFVRGNLKTLTISYSNANSKEIDILIKMWKSRDNCVVTKELKNFVKLSVAE